MGGKQGKTHPNSSEMSPMGSPDHSPSEMTNLHDSSSDEYGKAFTYDPKFHGPTKNRSCTDVLCLGLFLTFLAGWGVVGWIGISKGDIDKILYPTDSDGNICGRGEFVDRPVLLFFDLTRCLNPAVLSIGCPTPQVCIEACPTEIYSGYAAAKNSIPDSVIKQAMKPTCNKVSDKIWNQYTAKQLFENDICPSWVLPSTQVVGRCLPTLEGVDMEKKPNETIINPDGSASGKPVKSKDLVRAIAALGAFLNFRDFGERVFNDILSSWYMIVTGLLGTTILSFFWIFFMRFYTGILVWTSICAMIALFGGLFGYTLYKYLSVKDLTSAQGSIFTVNFTPEYFKDVLSLSDTWLAFMIISAIVLIVLLMLLIALRQRINIAIELIEQGSKAISSLWSSLFFPVLPFIFHILTIFWFLAVALYLASAGNPKYGITTMDSKDPIKEGQNITCDCFDPKTNLKLKYGDSCDPSTFNTTCICNEATCQFVKYVKLTDIGTAMNFYNLFGLFWASSFIMGMTELVLAGAFAQWYWTRDRKRNLPTFVVWNSLVTASIYHMGTVAFGSLIIAIIKFLRAILNYIDQKLKAYNNDLTKCLLCCCKCCLWCLEKFMKFINRNAYIVCAIKSTNFCSSARTAFNLLMRNILRVLVLNNVVGFLLLLGKLVIVLGVGVLSYFYFSGGISEVADTIPTLNFYFTPIVVIVCGSYLIASSFFSVYSMAVDTLFICFLEDLERNDGSPAKPYFMSKDLQKVVGKMKNVKTVKPA